jgi:flagellar motor switch protein FliG
VTTTTTTAEGVRTIPYVELTPLRRLALTLLAMGREAPLDWLEQLGSEERQALFTEMQHLEEIFHSRRWPTLWACEPLLQHRREGPCEYFRLPIAESDPTRHIRRLARRDGEWMKAQLRSLLIQSDCVGALSTVSTGLRSRQKVAILLMSLPPAVSAELFKELGPKEVEAITREIAHLPPTTAEDRDRVLSEFLELPESSTRSPLAGLLQSLDRTQLLHLLEGEDPPTIALLLRSLEPSKRTAVLEQMAPDLRRRVCRRLDTFKVDLANELASEDPAAFARKLRERWLK